jgi:putative copper export protein
MAEAPPPRQSTPLEGPRVAVDQTAEYDISDYPSASFDTIVEYLIGITVGNVLFSLLLVTLLALPALAARTARTRRLVLKALSCVRGAGEAGITVVAHKFAGSRSGSGSQQQQPEVVETAAAAGSAVEIENDLNVQEEVDSAERAAAHRVLLIWGLVGAALFVAAVVTIGLGTASMRDTVIE